MSHQYVQPNFAGQDLFIGLDVHKKSWTVCIRFNHMILKTFSMEPSAMKLAEYLRHHYPGGIYHSVYEAGFCGFSIHRKLCEYGIENWVINPADVPTTNKEKYSKNDKPDARKLARELENHSLTPIYVPDEYHEQLRSLVRCRYNLVKRETQTKNRIKSYLHLQGIEIPAHTELCHWSGAFIKWLKSLNFSHSFGKDYLTVLLEELEAARLQLAKTTRRLRGYVNDQSNLKKIVKEFITSVPGIGFVTAITLYTEIIDINRFPDLDRLCCYVGLVPHLNGSGENQKTFGITARRNQYLRYLIIEAAWVAIRKDPALTLAFKQLSERMKKTDAIIRIAKKLLNRIRFVWMNQTIYQIAVVQ